MAISYKRDVDGSLYQGTDLFKKFTEIATSSMYPVQSGGLLA